MVDTTCDKIKTNENRPALEGGLIFFFSFLPWNFLVGVAAVVGYFFIASFAKIFFFPFKYFWGSFPLFWCMMMYKNRVVRSLKVQYAYGDYGGMSRKRRAMV